MQRHQSVGVIYPKHTSRVDFHMFRNLLSVDLFETVISAIIINIGLLTLFARTVYSRTAQ